MSNLKYQILNKIQNLNIKHRGLIIGGLVTLSIIVFTLFIIKVNPEKVTLTENIDKGTLVVNTDKNQYLTGERVYIQMTSLDSQGNTLCESNLKLSITNDSQPTTHNNIPVSLSPTCDPENNTTFSPDYTAYFTPSSEGEYQIKLTNLDDNNSNEVQIAVSTDLSDFSITRWGATRINPLKTNRYPMKLTLTSNVDFSGQLVEQVPFEFEIIWQGPAVVEKQKESQTISWEVDLQKGESKELIYEYRIPAESSRLYLIGTASLNANGKVVFEEQRQWQIVSNK